jgi:hypothetical protein
LAKVKAIILENIDSSKSKAADLSNDFFNTLASCTNVHGFIETKPIDDDVLSDEHCKLCNGSLVFKDYCIET